MRIISVREKESLLENSKIDIGEAIGNPIIDIKTVKDLDT